MFADLRRAQRALFAFLEAFYAYLRRQPTLDPRRWRTRDGGAPMTAKAVIAIIACDGRRGGNCLLWMVHSGAGGHRHRSGHDGRADRTHLRAVLPGPTSPAADRPAATGWA